MGGERPTQVFIFSGPSGSGKSSVVRHLMKAVPGLCFSVSATTRAPRGGEQEGREYRFVSGEAFERMIAQGEFLEHANVFGHFYGTPRSNLAQARQQGQDLLLDVDVEGARQVKARLPAAVAVLLLPPSAQELEARLRKRAQDSPAVIQRRLQRARQEIGSYSSYDYLLVNRDLGETCRQAEAIVVAERAQRGGPNAGSGPARQAQ
ncbi:MAG: guanylate kinase, partial [Terriglobia bacterium]